MADDRTHGRAGLLALLAWMVVASGLHAQLVTGAVLETGTGSPVTGALVRLVDAGGRPVRTFLTAGDGRFHLSAATPGAYYLVVERIGYLDVRVGPVDLEAGGTVQRNVTLEETAIELQGLTVAGSKRRCDLTTEEADVTQGVWSRIRNALDAATWTSQEGNLSFRVRSRERRLKPGDLTVVEQSYASRWSTGGNSVRSLPAEDLAAGGYVRTAADGSIDYYAPDAQAILSDAFLSRHCFEVQEGRDGARSMVGLAFEPMADRDTVDVAGVMWLDATTGRLDRIAFSYVGLSYQVSAEDAGGLIRYSELPNGRWIVRDWYVRAPGFRLVRSTIQRRQMVEAVYESGAEVTTVRGPGFEWSPQLRTATLMGSVYDSTTSAALGGATVRLAGTGWRTRADGSGAFEMTGLPNGRYRVVFEHARLDSLGLAPRGLDVELDSLRPARVALAIPSRWTLLAETCPEGLGATVVGWTTTSDGATPAPRALVTIRDAEGPTLASVSAGADGAYQACDLPTGREVMLTAELLGSASDTVRLRTALSTYGRADLRIDLTARADTYAIAGVVVAVEGRSTVLSAAGFYTRMERVAGTFLDREKLGTTSARRLTDALLRQPALRRVDQSSRTGNTTRQLIQFRRAMASSGRGYSCMPAIYVDGALARQGQGLSDATEAAGFSTLDELTNASDIEGVELYESPSSIPAQFSGPGSLCGVIVVWTRR